MKISPRWLNQMLELGSDTNWNHLEGGWIGDGYTKWQILRIKKLINNKQQQYWNLQGSKQIIVQVKEREREFRDKLTIANTRIEVRATALRPAFNTMKDFHYAWSHRIVNTNSH